MFTGSGKNIAKWNAYYDYYLSKRKKFSAKNNGTNSGKNQFRVTEVESIHKPRRNSNETELCF